MHLIAIFQIFYNVDNFFLYIRARVNFHFNLNCNLGFRGLSTLNFAGILKLNFSNLF